MMKNAKKHFLTEKCTAKWNAYTKTPVTIEAIKVPRTANVIIAPKFEKNGFCQGKWGRTVRQDQMRETTPGGYNCKLTYWC